MIGKLWRTISGCGVYVCVATLVAQVVAVGYLCASGRLDNRRVDQILLAARGEIQPLAQPREVTPQTDIDQEQPSYEDREQARQLQSRQIEMREQALKSGLERIRFEQHNLTRDKERYDALQGAFDQRLEALRSKALTAGRENVRTIWENIKPKQAKEQIMEMIDKQEMNEVVTILVAMPIAKRAKIISEFKTPDELQKLDEMLQAHPTRSAGSQPDRQNTQPNRANLESRSLPCPTGQSGDGQTTQLRIATRVNTVPINTAPINAATTAAPEPNSVGSPSDAAASPPATPAARSELICNKLPAMLRTACGHPTPPAPNDASAGSQSSSRRRQTDRRTSPGRAPRPARPAGRTTRPTTPLTMRATAPIKVRQLRPQPLDVDHRHHRPVPRPMGSPR